MQSNARTENKDVSGVRQYSMEPTSTTITFLPPTPGINIVPELIKGGHSSCLIGKGVPYLSCLIPEGSFTICCGSRSGYLSRIHIPEIICIIFNHNQILYKQWTFFINNLERLQGNSAHSTGF